MANFHVGKMLGKVIGGYKILEHLGSGGNADVFKVIDKEHKYAAIKMLIVSDNKFFTKKYARFKDEIHIVKKYQNEIEGIIPISDIYLPKKPNRNDRPWYTMPIAEPLSKYISKLEHIEGVISCIHDLSRVLVCLHEQNIVHRDIKPNNIYYYNDSWAFSDFGLVDYPEKTDLTEKGESVGPKNTIAPEMKRDAINADGKPADVYSLAKTLWIMLTKVKDGFDGQYSHTIGAFNLDNFINNTNNTRCFTVTLHKILEKSTSNIPNERPSIEEFNSTLRDWFEINSNYQKRNILEWEFYLRDIIPYTLPEEISWTNQEDIIGILNMMSHTNLNHMFFPSGGGMDLIGCVESNQMDFIELDVGYTLKLKPKRLTLNTFKASFDWNYFYLEVEDIEPPITINSSSERKMFKMELIEITPGEYVFEDGINQNSIGRRLSLQLSGGFVLFAKGSSYNWDSSTYDARHNQVTPRDFRKYIQRSVDQMNFDKANPAVAKARNEERKRKQEEKEKTEREIFMKKLEEFNEIFEKKLQDILIPLPNRDAYMDSKIAFSVIFHLDIIDDKYYYISKEREIVHYATGWIEALKHRTSGFEDTLYFYDFIELEEFINYFEGTFEEFEKDDDIYFNMNIDVQLSRLRKPAKLFSRDDLQSLMNCANGDVLIGIDFDGDLFLENHSELSRIQRKRFPVISTLSEIGNMNTEAKDFETLYLLLLSAWLEHLSADKSKVITDSHLEVFDVNDHNENELLKAIYIAMDKYID